MHLIKSYADRLMQNRKGECKMKRAIISFCLIVSIFLLCSCEPLFTTYGEIVHDAVKEHYSSYEILSLVRIEKDGTPTLYNLCVVDDSHNNIDVLWMSTSKNETNDYTMKSTIIADNIELNKEYSVISEKQDLTVEYLVCEKKDIPDSVLQKEKFKFDGNVLYFCITNIVSTID